MLTLKAFRNLLKVAYFEEHYKVDGRAYRYNGQRREGVLYFKKGSSWQRLGKIYRSPKGWYYNVRGYKHGYWPEWWDAAPHFYQSWLTSPIRPSTPPPGRESVFPNTSGDLDDLDFKMFASKASSEID